MNKDTIAIANELLHYGECTPHQAVKIAKKYNLRLRLCTPTGNKLYYSELLKQIKQTKNKWELITWTDKV